MNNTKTVTVKNIVGKVGSGKTTKLIDILIDKSINRDKSIFVSNEIMIQNILEKIQNQNVLKSVDATKFNIVILPGIYVLLRNMKHDTEYLKDINNIFIDGSWSVKKKNFVYLMQNFDGVIYRDYQLPR